ncbi:MAG: hypothetical protein M3256_18770, partial [Actinomycetota bacterium]|nr:hypothetical protein [Actinomycetota bacterium]
RAPPGVRGRPRRPGFAWWLRPSCPTGWPPPPALSPAHHENVILYGSYPIEVERELAELEQTSYRSLRQPARREGEATAVNGRFSAVG